MLYNVYTAALFRAGDLLQNSEKSDFWGIFIAGVLSAFVIILLVRLLLKRKKNR